MNVHYLKLGGESCPESMEVVSEVREGNAMVYGILKPRLPQDEAEQCKVLQQSVNPKRTY